jgi:hypothetical protein
VKGERKKSGVGESKIATAGTIEMIGLIRRRASATQGMALQFPDDSNAGGADRTDLLSGLPPETKSAC